MSNLSLESVMRYIQPSYLGACSIIFLMYGLIQNIKFSKREDSVKNAEQAPR